MSCSDLAALLKDGECVPDCGAGFYSQDGVCYGKHLHIHENVSVLIFHVRAVIGLSRNDLIVYIIEVYLICQWMLAWLPSIKKHLVYVRFL